MENANPRAACVQALLRWEEGREFSDAIIHEVLAASSLAALDRALLLEVFYGILRNLTLLDFIGSRLREEPVDLRTRQILRLGFYQIFLTRIPPHAAVNETVNLAAKSRGLVNAVLRRCLREKEGIERALGEAPPATRFSHPEFLLKRWQARYGNEPAVKLCEWNNTPAAVFVRANALKVTAGELMRTGRGAEPVDFHPQMLKVRQLPFSWMVGGLCYVQDPSTLLACDLLAPQPGERILDACAAPGGKTTYIAQLMENSGEIVACDASPARLARLKDNLDRLGVENTRLVVRDWSEDPAPFEHGTFDRILVDAPCTNTGVLRRRIDARWRLRPSDFGRMAERQAAILKALLPLLRDGGVLVYSTCSLEQEENEGVVERIQPLRFVESKTTLPFRDGVDGAFAAKWVR